MALCRHPACVRDAMRRSCWRLLCWVYVLNFLDRQLLSILAKPIQDDLGLSDGQLGRLGASISPCATAFSASRSPGSPIAVTGSGY